MKPTTLLLSLFIGLIIGLVIASQLGCGNNPIPEPVKIDLFKEKQAIQTNEAKVETLYVTKERTRTKYETIIRNVYQLDSAAQDSLFKLIYPSIDSANATYYHALHEREQRKLSDSIIIIQDSTISTFKVVTAKQDTAIQDLQNQNNKLTKKVRFWQGVSAVLGALNLIR